MEYNEYEKKMMLTEAEYYALMLIYFNGKKTKLVEQMNYYYDTVEEDFYHNNITCRIRQIENKLIGTLKIHSGEKTDHSIEKSFEVRALPRYFVADGDDVYLQGQLYTKRLKAGIADGITLILDQNIYLGVTDYEMEIEYSEDKVLEAEKILDTVLELLSRSDQPQKAYSKSKRFFMAKHQMPIDVDLDISDL